MFAIMAWPENGTAEMVAGAFGTRAEAEADIRVREARCEAAAAARRSAGKPSYPTWRFRVAEVVPT